MNVPVGIEISLDDKTVQLPPEAGGDVRHRVPHGIAPDGSPPAFLSLKLPEARSYLPPLYRLVSAGALVSQGTPRCGCRERCDERAFFWNVLTVASLVDKIAPAQRGQ